MKKNLLKQISITLAAMMFLVICLPSMAADPGSNEDPLVSLSYVNDVLLPQMKSYVDSKLSAGNDTFTLLELQKGQTVIGGQSTQFILRAGKATVVATDKGGVADVTSGADLPLYTPVPTNHLLIIPFEDWRGITMQSNGILMVKGIYSIHN